VLLPAQIRATTGYCHRQANCESWGEPCDHLNIVVTFNAGAGGGSKNVYKRYNGGNWQLATVVSWSNGTCSPATYNVTIDLPVTVGATSTVEMTAHGSPNIITVGSLTHGGYPCDGIHNSQLESTTSLNMDGSVGCTSNGSIKLVVPGSYARGLVVINALVGSGGSGQLWQLSWDPQTGGDTGSIPASLGTVLEGGAISTQVVQGSYVIDSTGHEHTISGLTVSGVTGNAFHCGDNVVITATVAPGPTPTPRPSPSPTATPELPPNPTPGPSASSPVPEPSIPTPNQPVSTVTNPTTTVTGGGSGVTNQDIYNDVKQALLDAGYQSGPEAKQDEGIVGGTGLNLGDQPDGVGNLDDVHGIKDDVRNSIDASKTTRSAVQGKVDQIKNLELPTVGYAPLSWTIPKIGPLPSWTLDLTPWAAWIGQFRDLCLFALYFGFWWLAVATLRKGIA
jgi:hypothetical protein